MDTLIRIFGLPHEALHLLGLLLIGRRAVGWTNRHVDIPNDLTTRQYVIVAGMPAFVFGMITVIGVYGLLNAQTYSEVIVPIILSLIGGFGFVGTAGDLQLIADRLSAKR